MIVDTSALIALAAAEANSDELLQLLHGSSNAAMSAPSYLECFLVADRRSDPVIARRVEALIAEFPIRIVPFTDRHALIARRAYRDYGKGSGHPAGLNFGDCFSYALAIDTDQPLLFVGNDFQHTDVRIAEY